MRKENLMRGVSKRSVIIFAAAMLVLASAACTPSGGSGPGSELVMSKCTLCHTIDRINQAKKDLPGWEQTIARMRVHGAVLTDAEATQIADYLSKSSASK
jgi:hypothetical protein